jgi:hypothetical protein
MFVYTYQVQPKPTAAWNQPSRVPLTGAMRQVRRTEIYSKPSAGAFDLQHALRPLCLRKDAPRPGLDALTYEVHYVARLRSETERTTWKNTICAGKHFFPSGNRFPVQGFGRIPSVQIIYRQPCTEEAMMRCENVPKNDGLPWSRIHSRNLGNDASSDVCSHCVT